MNRSIEVFRKKNWLLASFFQIGACTITSEVSAQTESAINPDVASSLANFGLTFVVGTYELISSSGKSNVQPEDATIIANQTKMLVDQYQERVRTGAFGANMLHTTLSVAITSGQVLGSSTVAGAVPAAAIATIVRYGNDKARDYLIGDSVAKAAAALSQGIDSMSSADKTMLESLLSQNKFEEAAQRFEGSTKKLSSMKDAFGDDVQAKAMMDKAIQSALMKGSTIAIKQAGVAYAKTVGLEASFINHIKGVSAFTTEAAAKFKQLDESVKDLKTGLNSITNRMSDIEQVQKTTDLQVQVIQDVLFDDQPPSVKLVLLNSGAKPELTDKQLSDLRNILETQIKQQYILDKANKVVGYARDMNTILTNFGVNDPGLNKAVQYGTVATAALSQAFSGNYLGAIASVSGLFGGGGPDPMQQQFERVFAELAKIDKKLDEVIRLQQETLQAIETLSHQLADVARRLNHRFDRLDFEVAKLNSKIEQGIWNEIAGCESAWKVRNNIAIGSYDDSAKRFTSYHALERYTNSYGDRAYVCQTTLVKLYSGMRNQSFTGNPISLILVKEQLDKTTGVPDEVENEQYGKSALNRYSTQLHEPSFNLLRLSWAIQQAKNSGWGNLTTAYALLSTPSATASDLISRVDFLNKVKNSRPCTVNESFVGLRMKVYLCTDSDRYVEKDHQNNDARALQTATSFLQTPIVRDQVGELTKYAGLVAGPSDIAIGAGSPGARSLNSVIKNNRASLGREIVTGALMVSDVSIAQQAMIYGDLTAWFVFEQLWDTSAKRFRLAAASTNEKTLFEAAKNLLGNSNNPWLQRNVLMLILQSAEKPCISISNPTICTNRAILYRAGYEKFFPMEGKMEKSTLVAPSIDIIAAAKNWMLGLFDIHSDVVFEVSDTVGIHGVPRRVMFKLDGYTLQMPTVNDWKNKALVYPPMMYERLNDTTVLAQRLADYTVFDGIKFEEMVNLVRITTKGVQ